MEKSGVKGKEDEEEDEVYEEEGSCIWLTVDNAGREEM